MKRIFLFIALLTLPLFAEYKSEYITKKLLDSKTPIVDIRTPPEWRETGLLKGAIPIMFFDQRGGYNIDKFLKELNAKVDTSKPFAIICHTGSRTSIVGPWMSQKLGYKVINLQGGMDYATRGLKLITYPYKK
ncbi:rhodanese-like domain-containing protein [Sulfurimonas marina]|uniref:Rhodanese-like domain-containing protein n=1 Tax=Sulfurimonas marina TaxID=2590551 RepID=A0A7M1ATU9_9BACT|nr:rhodanese-like domain-containing protein [Sulfurimonas marina]QOP40851.1 rhodanese-like domain-containing protein [Sulfurimonas marina]